VPLSVWSFSVVQNIIQMRGLASILLHSRHQSLWTEICTLNIFIIKSFANQVQQFVRCQILSLPAFPCEVYILFHQLGSNYTSEHWTSPSRGLAPLLVFGRSPVQISAQGLAILSEVSRFFLSSSRKCRDNIPQIRSWPLPWTFFTILYSLRTYLSYWRRR
jgi:hypothetical protein